MGDHVRHARGIVAERREQLLGEIGPAMSRATDHADEVVALVQPLELLQRADADRRQQVVGPIDRLLAQRIL
ncbi:MAG: hypothetical protein ACREMQ_13070 [Longimicrobiales bacterium]